MSIRVRRLAGMILMCGVSALAWAGGAAAEDVPVECPKVLPAVPNIARSDVYKDVPFKAGESGSYELTWLGQKVGYATLDVRSPRLEGGIWHRVFHVDASTGDWFKAIFVAKDAIESISRPWDFGVTKFYMEQNEGKIFSSPFVQQKWLEFDHNHCKVRERIKVPEKPEETIEHPLAYGAIDALGVAYNFRTRSFKLGKVERALIYTSEKNWWLEATPVAFESVTVPGGTFKTVKLKLQTFIGKDLQQKGDVWAWYAVDTPSRQLIQIEGEIKLGSVFIKLATFKPGS